MIFIDFAGMKLNILSQRQINLNDFWIQSNSLKKPGNL